MRAVAREDAAHAHGRCTFQQCAGDNHVRLRDGVASTSDGQDAVVNALHDLADSSLDSSLIAQLGDILATLADDDTSFFGGYDGAQSQLGLSILLVGSRRRFSVGSESRLAVVELNTVQADSKVVSVGRKVVLVGRHGRIGLVDVWWVEWWWWWGWARERIQCDRIQVAVARWRV